MQAKCQHPQQRDKSDALRHDDPPFELSLVALGVHADLDDFFISGFVLYRVALVVDLLYGLFGGSIELELKYIYCIFGFYQGIATACSTALLRSYTIVRRQSKD